MFFFEERKNMQCWCPQFIWRLKYPDAKGKRGLIWNRNDTTREVVPHVQPCGQCAMCRLEKSRRVAVRLMHENQMHSKTCFVTLTYDAKHLPSNLSISTDEIQRFWKRLRKKYKNIKYYASGEYGDEFARPHYHAIVFGMDFDDKKPWKKSPSGEQLYISNKLQKIWGNGFCSIGEVTFESCAYVARYVMKKVTGKGSREYYEMFGIEPERSWSSQGLAKSWYEKFNSGVWSYDEVIIRGQKMLPPPYYDKLLEKDNPFLYTEIKNNREKNRKSVDMDDFLSYGRYQAKEKTHNALMAITKVDNNRKGVK